MKDIPATQDLDERLDKLMNWLSLEREFVDAGRLPLLGAATLEAKVRFLLDSIERLARANIEMRAAARTGAHGGGPGGSVIH